MTDHKQNTSLAPQGDLFASDDQAIGAPDDQAIGLFSKDDQQIDLFAPDDELIDVPDDRKIDAPNDQAIGTPDDQIIGAPEDQLISTPVTSEDFTALLSLWADAGAIRELDKAFVRFIADRCPETPIITLLAITLVCERNGHGHICLDLQQALDRSYELLSGLEQGTPQGQAVRYQLEALLPDSVAQWQADLQSHPAIFDQQTLSGDAPQTAENTTGNQPLVLAGTPERPLLYLRRYWDYEWGVLSGIHQRLRQQSSLNEAVMSDVLDHLFPANSAVTAPGEPDWQKVACALSARAGFSVITGGPGTGKTTTVVKLLALLQTLRFRQGETPWRIRLAAPTGKAAARLNESIRDKLAQNSPGFSLAGLLDDQGEHQMSPELLALSPDAREALLRRSVPAEVTTLHRLLGPKPDSRFFRHHRNNPLPVDIVVVDEASMVDIEMMAQLMDALMPETRLILLGDKDQLASVEAGAVLGDLCLNAAEVNYSPETVHWLKNVTGYHIPEHFMHQDNNPLNQAVTMLRFSHRFRSDGGIGALAMLVNEHQVQNEAGQLAPVNQPLSALKALFRHEQSREDTASSVQASDTRMGRDPTKNNPTKNSSKKNDPAQTSSLNLIYVKAPSDPALSQLFKGYHHYLDILQKTRPEGLPGQRDLDEWAYQVLEGYSDFQVLTALRRGVWGLEGLNDVIRQTLVQQKKLSDHQSIWYEGRPVLVTRNNYSLKLMNGDIGIALRVPVASERYPGQTENVLRVAFPAETGGRAVRWVMPGRLQDIETVFAMTVHKSQGSEFRHTALILPDRSNPVLTRELLYTGITRSKAQFSLVCSRDDVLDHAMKQSVYRVSGIASERL